MIQVIEVQMCKCKYSEFHSSIVQTTSVLKNNKDRIEAIIACYKPQIRGKY